MSGSATCWPNEPPLHRRLARALRVPGVLLCMMASGAHGAGFEDYAAVLAAGDAAALARMLATQDEPWPRSPQGAPLLHLACSYHHAKNQDALVEALLAAGAEVDAREAGGSTALYWAAGYGCEACVRRLLAAGAFVSAPGARGRTPLHVAAAAIVPLLLQAGADPAARDGEGSVPLHHNRHAALLAPGVDVRNDHGFTPLHFAALDGDAEGARMLLDNGADPRAESTREYRFKDGVLADAWDPVLVLDAGVRPYDVAAWRHDGSKWSTGEYRAVWELLDSVTPRRGLLRR